MRLLRLSILGAFSSVLLALALPNEMFSWGNPTLGLIALAPLFVALASTRSFREAFLAGAIFGGLAHGLSSYWLWFFKDFRFWTLGTSSAAYMIVYGCIGMYLRAALKRTGMARTLVFAMAWAVIEWGKSSGFLGYPWGLVAYSWNTVLPATQIAESTGVYGLSFALAFVSAALGEMFAPLPDVLHAPGDKTAERPMRGRLRFLLPARPAYPGNRFLASGHLVVSAVLLLAITGYGLVALDKARTPRGFVDAVMVQQNVDSWLGSESENLGVSVALARKAIAVSEILPDVVLFSETTLRRPWNGFERFYAKTPGKDPLARFIADSGAYLFTGAPEILDYDTYEATNSVILINPQGKQTGTYAKIHPVPFAEAIPFWEYEPFRKFIQDVVGLESGWVMGTERVVFELPTKSAGIVRFSAPICFEDAVSTLCREFIQEGAEILVNLTNDSWSKTDSAEIQHFVAARFRSIELRRTLVRSTNGGVSAIVGPDGHILEILPLFQATSKMVSIPVYVDEVTPYLVYGDWFAFVLACILLVLAIILFVDDSTTMKELS
jgi:apolipoprotein N-acyltransferase